MYSEVENNLGEMVFVNDVLELCTVSGESE